MNNLPVSLLLAAVFLLAVAVFSEGSIADNTEAVTELLIQPDSSYDQLLESCQFYQKQYSYSSLSDSLINGRVAAANIHQVNQVFGAHRRWRQSRADPFRLTVVGSSMSFGEQALPPKPDGLNIYLTLNLNKMNRVEVRKVLPDRVRVWIEAGVTWEQLISTASNITGKLLIPFDTPSSDKITVAGSLASNTFSRTSYINGGHVSQHIHSFELLTPEAYLRCSADAGTLAERECFQIIPGSLGIAGAITSIELDLQIINPKDVIHTKVLEHTHGIADFVKSYTRLARENRKNREWNQGFYAILHDYQGEPYGILMGSKFGRYANRQLWYSADPGANLFNDWCMSYVDFRFYCSGGMPIYNSDPRKKGFLIWLARQLTPYTVNSWAKNNLGSFHTALEPWIQESIPDWIKSLGLYPGAVFTNAPYDYTFYHNGYWEAHGGTSRQALPNMHQAWVMDISYLGGFMTAIRDLMTGNPDYQEYVQKNIILQDVTPIPANNRPMSPVPAGSEDSDSAMTVVYQITVSLSNGDNSRLISESRSFFQKLSGQVADFAHVHLLKEAYVDDEILRRQYRRGIEVLKQFRQKYDPDNIFTSMLWERLLSGS